MRPSCAPHAPGRAEGQIESETPADMPAGVSNEGLTWSGVRHARYIYYMEETILCQHTLR